MIRRAAAAGTAARFLALSVSDAAEDVIAVIRAGARGYVTKNISPADLVDAVRRVHDGDAVFSPRLAGFVLDAFAGPAPQPETELDELTPREREVIQHIARGYMYKEIALRLEISPKTVEAHVSSVLRKLQLSSRHELTRWAADRGLGTLVYPVAARTALAALDLALLLAVLDRAALVVHVLALSPARARPSRAGRLK